MYNLEWLNENMHRKFPFMHECSLKDKTGYYTIPDSIFLDILIQVNIDYQYMFYISKIEYTPEYFSVTVSVNETEALKGTCLPTDTVLTLYGQDAYKGSFGKIILGNFSEIHYLSLDFSAASAIIEPCRVIKLCSGINSINDITEGNVNLVGKTNVIVEKDGNNINISTKDGLCACDSIPCIKTINGIEPINNDFKITPRGCVSINSITGGIEIGNNCESSCCGCDEINDFVDRINSLEKRIRILEGD